MICFSDEDLDRQARKWTWLGINKDTFARTHSSGSYRWQYDVEHVGFKYHGNSVMAAMGLVALRYLEQDNGHRRRMAAVYDRFLKEVAGVELVPMAADCTPSRHLYQVLVDDRDRVMVGLNDREIYPGVHYQDNTAYRMYERDDEDCPRARLAAQRIISLPLHLGLDEEQVVRVAGAVRELTTP
jgi:dTDP-4-amino-4,6-dideoxygalactose transaminase